MYIAPAVSFVEGAVSIGICCKLKFRCKAKEVLQDNEGCASGQPDRLSVCHVLIPVDLTSLGCTAWMVSTVHKRLRELDDFQAPRCNFCSIPGHVARVCPLTHSVRGRPNAAPGGQQTSDNTATFKVQQTHSYMCAYPRPMALTAGSAFIT